MTVIWICHECNVERGEGEEYALARLEFEPCERCGLGAGKHPVSSASFAIVAPKYVQCEDCDGTGDATGLLHKMPREDMIEHGLACEVCCGTGRVLDELPSCPHGCVDGVVTWNSQNQRDSCTHPNHGMVTDKEPD